MRVIPAFLAVVFLAACATPGTDQARVYGTPKKLGPTTLTPQQVQSVEATVARTGPEPQSAAFRKIKAAEVRFMDGFTATGVCGEMNSRDISGGMTGYQPFRGYFDETGRFIVFEIAGLAAGSCQTQFGIRLNEG